MRLTARAVLVTLVLAAAGCGGGTVDLASEADAAKADAKLVHFGGAGGTSFGRRVAATRNTLAVAASEESAIYVYGLSGGVWALSAIVPSPEPAEWTGFGKGLAISTGHLAVGEPNGLDGGRVYLYRKVGAGWVHEETLTPPGPEYVGFGESVALDGHRLLVGAPCGDAGAVLAYERKGNGWVLEQSLRPAEPLGYDAFGWDVAVKDGVLVVGAPQTYAYVERWSRGAAYVFELGREGWKQTAFFDEPMVTDGGMFAVAVAVDGDVLVVSCDCPDGEAYVYERVDGTWQLVRVLEVPWGIEGTRFSHDVAVANGHVFVTAPARSGAAEGAGTVVRYERDADAGWMLDGELAPPVASEGLWFGAAIVAHDEMVTVASSPNEGAIPVWLFPAGAR